MEINTSLFLHEHICLSYWNTNQTCKIVILVAGLVLVSAEKSETRRFETKIKTRGFETKTETKTKQTGLETKTSLETSNTDMCTDNSRVFLRGGGGGLSLSSGKFVSTA